MAVVTMVLAQRIAVPGSTDASLVTHTTRTIPANAEAQSVASDTTEYDSLSNEFV